MYIIDETYFTELIPNINTQMDSSVKDRLEKYIDKYSRLMLKASLGKDNYIDFDSNVTDGVLNIGAPLKWHNLVSGTSYTYNNDEYYWKGIIQEYGTEKSSLLVDYIYNKYATNNLTAATDNGRVILDVKTAKNVNSNDYLRPFWNNFVRQYRGDIYDYQQSFRLSKYKDKTNNVSLIKFLEQNDTDYPNAAMSLRIENDMVKVKNWASI